MSDRLPKTEQAPGLVITELRCGLGNQLFQYAVGRALAHHHQAPLKVDTSIYKHGHLNAGIRSYRLEKYNISGSVATRDEIDGLRQNERTYFHRKRGYHPQIWQTPQRVYIQGFWLSEEYFREIRKVLLGEFSLKQAPDEDILTLGHRMTQTGSVSLHVRRTDYLSAEQLYSLPASYYHSAVEKLAKLAGIDEIFVFSDDEHWARNHLQFQYPTRFMVGNKDYEDLWLMSQCRHHIIANSTFSWWGAWLASDAGQTVFAPRQWFKTRKVTRLIPERWHQL